MTTAVYNFVPRQAKHVRVPAPPGGHMQIEDLLLRHGAITEEQLQRAREDQKILGGDLGRILVDLRFITDDLLCRTKAHQLKIPRASPDRLSIAHELLQLIPVQVCEKLGVIAVGRERRDNTLQIATNDPGNQQHLQAVAQAIGERVLLRCRREAQPGSSRQNSSYPTYRSIGSTDLRDTRRRESR